MSRCFCENCGKPFDAEGEYYDLCDDCVGPYEEALYEQQQQELNSTGEITSLRVPFPK